MSRISYISSFRVLKCVLFAGLVLLIASGLERLFHRVSSAEARFDAFYEVDRNSLDYVILGNSHAYVSYDPVMVQNVLGVNGFVLGSGGQSVVKAYYDLVEVFKYHKPKTVFLEAYGLYVPASKTRLQHRYHSLDGMRWSLNKLQAGHLLLEPSQYVDAAFKLVRAHNRWKKPEEISDNLQLFQKFRNRIHNGWTGFSAVDGYVPAKVGKKVSRVAKKHYSPVEDNLVYLSMIRDLCIKRDARLVLVMAPVLPAFRDMDQLNAGIRSACSDLGVEFADLHTDPKWRSEYRFFKDAQHVNRYGACVATRELIVFLYSRFDLTLDSLTLEKEHASVMCSYVQSVSMSDMPDGQVEFSVTTAASAGEEYAFYLIRDGEKLIIQRYGPNPIFRFRAVSDGSFKVQYYVRNPSGPKERGEYLFDVVNGVAISRD